MAAVAVDTHAIVWYLANDIRLSKKAAEAMDLATAAGGLPGNGYLAALTDFHISSMIGRNAER